MFQVIADSPEQSGRISLSGIQGNCYGISFKDIKLKLQQINVFIVLLLENSNFLPFLLPLSPCTSVIF